MIWSEVSTLLETCTAIHLANLEIQTAPSTVEHFPLKAYSTSSPSTTVVASAPASASASALVPAKPIDSEQIAELPPPLPTPVARVESLITNSVSYKVSEEPFPKKLKIYAAKSCIDPVVLGIELVEPLYIGAPHSTQKSIEIDAAQKLESQLDALYKSCCGRSRGWTKVGLEGMLKPRCASGGDLKELDRAKKGFLWSLATEDKALSAFLDFVCCAKQIRCAVMNAERKTAHLYPAADRLDDDGAAVSYPIYFVDTGGHKMNGLHDSKDLLRYVDSEGWTLQPPASVTHSLSGLSLDELESVGLKLGMSAVSGKKTERVVAVAAYKTHLRLTAS